MKMYLKSLQFNGFLKVNEHLSLPTEMIATLTRHEVGTVERAVKIFLELGLAETTDTGGQNVDICPQNVRTTLDICPPEIRDKSIENRDYIKESVRNRGSGEKTDAHAPSKHGKGINPYGRYENVILTDKEMETRKSNFPADYQSMIEHLSEYMAYTGKTYKNHLATMECWKKADLKKQRETGKGVFL